MKSTSRKKWYVLVPLDRFPSLSMHSVARELLYNMSLESNFTIERFQSYTLLNLVQIFHFNVWQCMDNIIQTYIPKTIFRYAKLSKHQKLFFLVSLAFKISLTPPSSRGSHRYVPCTSICDGDQDEIKGSSTQTATIKGSRRLLDNKSDQNQDDFAMLCILLNTYYNLSTVVHQSRKTIDRLFLAVVCLLAMFS